MKAVILLLMSLTVVLVKAKKGSMWTTCPTVGVGGNGHVYGSPCYFPFKYKGKYYYECTKKGSVNGRPWCHTIPNGMKNSPYAECDPTKCKKVPHFAITCDTTGHGGDGHREGDKCYYPFVHHGRRYTSCKKGGKGRPFCYTVPHGSSKKKSPWAHCVPGSCHRVPDEAITCDTTGHGGNGHHKGDKCYYPYKHKGRRITKCTRAGRSKPFCYTVPFGSQKKKSPWAHCLQKTCTRVPAEDFTCDTVNGKKCYFPFKYKGKEYSSCTSAGAKFAWCFTVPDGREGDPYAQCKLKTCRRMSHHDDY